MRGDSPCLSYNIGDGLAEELTAVMQGLVRLILTLRSPTLEGAFVPSILCTSALISWAVTEGGLRLHKKGLLLG